LIAHNSGRGAKYTRSRRPVELVVASSEMTKSDALKLEYRVKQVPASKKNLEFKNEENKMTKNLKKDLQSVNKELKALAKKVDGIIIAVDKLEKSKAAKKPKAKPVKKKAPVKKAPARKVAVKKVAPKKAVPKKAKPATAVDTVLVIIKRSKKGVGMAALMEKTGYNQKKIANLVFKLRKQGKIKSVAKGVYLKA
jgi:predicted GIY-YIG superfamily endonuclease